MPLIPCYPPAETRIPFKALLQAALGREYNPGRAVCEATGSTYCFFGPSARGLLLLLLKALQSQGQGRRNEVLIPGYTCYSVPAAVVKSGLKFRFYDLDPSTLQPDPQSLRSNCDKHTLAIISQHLFGIPAELDAVGEIARESGGYHIEDTAQAFGTRRYGRALGTQGDFGLFSFGRGKVLPLGGGGVLISQHHNLAKILPPMATRAGRYSLAVNLFTRIAANPYLYGMVEMLPIGLGETIYDPDFKLEALSLAQQKLLQSSMVYLPEMNAHRKTIARIYRSNIKASRLIAEPDGCEAVYPRFPVMANAGSLPIELWRLGVRRLYPNALNKEPAIASQAINGGQTLSGAEIVAQRLVTLPTHHSINEKVAKTIAERMNHWFAH